MGKLPGIKKALSASRFAGLIAIAMFALLRFWDPAPMEIARNFFFDSLQKAHPRPLQDFPALIVDIDDKSLSEIGQWPWPRTLLAKLIARLSEDGAAVTGFDMIFPENDRASPQSLAALILPGDEDLKRKLSAMPGNDELFAQAIKGARIVLGRTALSGETPHEKPAASKTLPKASFATIGGDPRADLQRYAAALKNLPVLEAAASGIGMLTVKPERDGLIRRVPLVLTAGNEIVPALAVELIRAAAGARSIVIKRDEAGMKSIVLAGFEIPTGSDGQLWVPFTHHSSRRYVGAADVLAGRVPRERIEGKIVIVGTSASGLFDLKSTPLDRVIPGVEIHAQIVESILGGTTLTRPNFALGLEISLAVAIGLILVITAPLASALANLLTGSVIAVLLAGGSWYLFTADRILIDVSYPLASSFAVFLLMTFMNYLREEKRRTQVRTAFRQYLSPNLVEQLIREPGRLVLGGETREISILFSDVRGFTSIAETYKDNPAGLTAQMNRMLTSLSHPIIGRRGTIDKYIGDAIMAFWNAPLDDPDHALNACCAALDMLSQLDKLNALRKEEGLQADAKIPEMRIGIGISTGLSVAGNMGSDIRFNYSVLGDSVNLASRLESLTAYYGVRILIASGTARRCQGKIAMIEADRIRVKGKQDVETIYVVLGGQDLARHVQFLMFQSAFHSMLAPYRAQNWQEALVQLDRCRALDPPDGLLKLLDIYSARIARFAADPPPADWDGVFKASRVAD